MVVPLLTALLAFLIGGLVVLITGNDPIATYEAIFEGTGPAVALPVAGEDRELAALNLQQTLIITTPLILTGLAVAFAFRAGLFNIGGQGQYIVGSIAAVWVGSSFAGMPGFLHIVLAIVAACLAGAFWAGIAGALKATVGANEVISTIMLNYTAIYIGLYLFGLGGPLQNDRDASLPVSNDVVEAAHLPVFWGDSDPPGAPHRPVHRAGRGGRLLAHPQPLDHRLRGARRRPQPRGGPLRRHERVEELRARDGRLRPVRRAWPARSTCSAGSSAWPPTTSRSRSSASSASPSRCWGATPRSARSPRRCCSARCSAAPRSATSTRSIFEPELAENLTYIIQGLVVLVVSADVLVLGALRRGRGVFRESVADPLPARRARRERRHHGRVALGDRAGPARLVRGRRCGALAWFIALPPLLVRTPVPSLLLAPWRWRRA